MESEESKVRVTADAAGNVVTPSKKNMAWGHICLSQTKIVIDDRGFARPKRITTLIHGLLKDLKGFNWNNNQELKGTIIIKEQLTPFNKKEPQHDYKVAGKTGIVCTIDDQPIYFKTFYKANPSASDEFILDEQGNRMFHDNTEDIKYAYRMLALADTPETVNIDPDLNIM